MTNYYFENDPLAAVYADLYAHKTPTHFDRVLALKDKMREDFAAVAMDMVFANKPKNQNSYDSQKMKGCTQ